MADLSPGGDRAIYRDGHRQRAANAANLLCEGGRNLRSVLTDQRALSSQRSEVE
jgi:hypothetical protein